MKLIDFEGQNAVIAKSQPQYMPMPAHVDKGKSKIVTCCWQLNKEERRQVAETGVIWHQVMTFGNLLQPQLLMTEKPELK